MNTDNLAMMGYALIIILLLSAGYFGSQHSEGNGFEVTYQDKHIEYIEADLVALELNKITFKIKAGMFSNMGVVTAVRLGDVIMVKPTQKIVYEAEND